MEVATSFIHPPSVMDDSTMEDYVAWRQPYDPDYTHLYDQFTYSAPAEAPYPSALLPNHCSMSDQNSPSQGTNVSDEIDGTSNGEADAEGAARKPAKKKRRSSKELSGLQREEYLAKNRAAASKSREKRKAMENKLEDRLHLVQAENAVLRHQIDKLRDEIVTIKCMCLQHVDCDCSRIREHMYKLLDDRLAAPPSSRDGTGSAPLGSPTSYNPGYIDPRMAEHLMMRRGST